MNDLSFSCAPAGAQSSTPELTGARLYWRDYWLKSQREMERFAEIYSWSPVQGPYFRRQVDHYARLVRMMEVGE